MRRSRQVIAFSALMSGSIGQLFIAPASGAGNPVQLTSFADYPGLAVTTSRSWSPDGTKLLAMAPNPYPNFDLFTVDALSGGLSRISAGYHYDAAWSPDGSPVAYSDFSSIFIMAKTGSNVRQLYRGGGFSPRPRWVPRGARGGVGLQGGQQPVT